MGAKRHAAAWRGPGLPPGTRALTPAEQAYVRRGRARGQLFGVLGFVIFGGLVAFGLALPDWGAVWAERDYLTTVGILAGVTLPALAAVYFLLWAVGPWLERLGIPRYRPRAVGRLHGTYAISGKPVGPALDDVFINVPVEWWNLIPYGPIEFEVFPSPEEVPGRFAERAVLAVPVLGLSVDEDVRAGRIRTSEPAPNRAVRPQPSDA